MKTDRKDEKQLSLKIPIERSIKTDEHLSCLLRRKMQKGHWKNIYLTNVKQNGTKYSRKKIIKMKYIEDTDNEEDKKHNINQ